MPTHLVPIGQRRRLVARVRPEKLHKHVRAVRLGRHRKQALDVDDPERVKPGADDANIVVGLGEVEAKVLEAGNDVL
jgi:hypothetical protein